MSKWEQHWNKEIFHRGEGPFWQQYFFNIGISLSQMPNTFLFGDCDESISSRLGRCVLDPQAHWIFKKIAAAVDKVFGKDHCVNAVEKNINRKKEIWHWSSTTDYPVPAEYVPHFDLEKR